MLWYLQVAEAILVFFEDVLSSSKFLKLRRRCERLNKWRRWWCHDLSIRDEVSFRWLYICSCGLTWISIQIQNFSHDARGHFELRIKILDVVSKLKMPAYKIKLRSENFNLPRSLSYYCLYHCNIVCFQPIGLGVRKSGEDANAVAFANTTDHQFGAVSHSRLQANFEIMFEPGLVFSHCEGDDAHTVIQFCVSLPLILHSLSASPIFSSLKFLILSEAVTNSFCA